MSADEVGEIAEGLNADEQKALLEFEPEWLVHFQAEEVIVVGRLGGLGLLSFVNSYEGPMAMLTDRGKQVAERLSRG